MEDKDKKPLTGKFTKAIKLTAMTLGMVVSVQSFAQYPDCDDSGGYDDDCIELDPIGATGGSGGSGGWDPGPGWVGGGGGYSGGGSSGGSSGGGGGSGGVTTIGDNPHNNQDASCGGLAAVRSAHARSDLGYAWNQLNQRPSPGSIVKITYDTGETELYVFNGIAAPPTPVANSCG